jgi:protease-4
MTTRQKASIAAILIAPVLIGLWLAAAHSTHGPSPLSSKFFKKIGLVEINDVILVSEPYVRQLRAFREDDAIAGVLLRIDSPGGAVAPSQEIYQEVMEFRKINKPLVVSCGNVAASGGYYIASPALRIFANPGSITGSIGVIFRFPQYYKLLDKIGVSVQTLKSGGLKDIGNPQREMTPQEKSLLQNLLDDIHSQFMEDVAKARSIRLDSLRPVADGRIFDGRQAVKARLVDTLGGFEDALAFLKEYCGLPEKTQLVEKKKQESFWQSLIFGDLMEKIPLFKNTLWPSGSYFLYERPY